MDSFSASFLEAPSALTLKPITKESVVNARLTSLVLIAPTASWTILIFISSFSRFFIEPIIASKEP